MAENRKIIAIAASTGGVDALAKILPQLPASTPPIALVLHMMPGFSKMLAAQFDGMYKISVKEARQDDCLLPGQMIIAPAGRHMQLVDRQGKFFVDFFSGVKVNDVIPSADVLFESVAKIPQISAVGVILTGIGSDGAKGLKMMRDSGARTIGQNKETSTIYGMPKVAMEMGAVEFQLPLNQIADKILSLI